MALVKKKRDTVTLSSSIKRTLLILGQAQIWRGKTNGALVCQNENRDDDSHVICMPNGFLDSKWVPLVRVPAAFPHLARAGRRILAGLLGAHVLRPPSPATGVTPRDERRVSRAD